VQVQLLSQGIPEQRLSMFILYFSLTNTRPLQFFPTTKHKKDDHRSEYHKKMNKNRLFIALLKG